MMHLEKHRPTCLNRIAVRSAVIYDAPESQAHCKPLQNCKLFGRRFVMSQEGKRIIKVDHSSFNWLGTIYFRD